MNAKEAGPATPEAADAELGDRRGLAGLALIAAVASLVALGVFTAYMISQADLDDEVTWTRLAWLFTSVEAIAFAAAGALFGAKIHRERAEKAESEARQYAGDAARGRALAAAIKADEIAEGATRGLGEAGEEGTLLRARHARLARELFPD
jgi:hypothetical protein